MVQVGCMQSVYSLQIKIIQPSAGGHQDIHLQVILFGFLFTAWPGTVGLGCHFNKFLDHARPECLAA
jgi:hypothetical protein